MEKIQIPSITNGRVVITTDPVDIKRITNITINFKQLGIATLITWTNSLKHTNNQTDARKNRKSD